MCYIDYKTNLKAGKKLSNDWIVKIILTDIKDYE